MSNPPSIVVIVPAELEGQRLDVVIARLAPEVSRRAARRLIDDGAVFVEGKRVHVSSRPCKPGARIEISVPQGPPRAEVTPGLVLLDQDLVVADKPAGVPTEPTREGSRGTLLAALEDLLKARGEDASYLHAVHRLDTDTTGVVVFARSPDAARAVGRQLHDNTAERRYLAIVEGTPEWTRTRLDQPLTKGRDAEGRVRIDRDNGVPALTLATVLARGTTGSLVLCAPQTGRTHQLRVHLADAGHALVGDRRYGLGRRGREPHLGLHALTLVVVHPRGGVLKLVAPPPEGFFQAAEARGLPRAVVADVVGHLSAPPTPGDAGGGPIATEEGRGDT